MSIFLCNLKPAQNSRHRKKILGRGYGSGHGKTSTRGTKGQKSRTGDGAKKIGFEGGQTAFFRRIPKKGFKKRNNFKNKHAIINIKELNKFDSGTNITPIFLQKLGIISKKIKHVKILGVGSLKKAVTVTDVSFSKSAFNKIKNIIK
ncbi:MAG: 50S ribosomal protein L15 [Endomicrobium sp.]|jgi:large subunit ribosomal protein L15|nr:50S ribosomal protein L15 [Endomicrobium sp.]